jgi:hypothetical protein
MMATYVQLVQAQSQSQSSLNDRTMADWRRFNDHTFSQERTLAGGVPKVHDLNARRIHRKISGLKEFGPMGFRPRVRTVGPAGLVYALAASHEAMFARPNAAARWPLKDASEHLHPSGSYTGLPARTGSPNATVHSESIRVWAHWAEPTRPCEA